MTPDLTTISRFDEHSIELRRMCQPLNVHHSLSFGPPFSVLRGGELIRATAFTQPSLIWLEESEDAIFESLLAQLESPVPSFLAAHEIVATTKS